jgi:hypothetical protein
MINEQLSVSDRKLSRITDLILKNRRPPGKDWFWPINELNGKPLDKKRANKFLLCGILDYQIKTERALENAKRLSIDILGDPKDIWNVIAEYSEKVTPFLLPFFTEYIRRSARSMIWSGDGYALEQVRTPILSVIGHFSC